MSALSPNISACLSGGCKTMTVNDITGLYNLINNLTGWEYPNESKAYVTAATLQILAPDQTVYTTIDVTTAVSASSTSVEEFLLAQLSYSDLGLTTNFTDGVYEFIYTVSGVNNYAPTPPANTGNLAFSSVVQACVGTPATGDILITFSVTNNTGSTLQAITFRLPDGNLTTVATPAFLTGTTIAGVTITFVAGTYTPGIIVELDYMALNAAFGEVTEGLWYVVPMDCGTNQQTFEYVYRTTKVFVCNARCCVDQQIASLAATFNSNCGCCENREKVKDLQLADMLITSIENSNCVDVDVLASHLDVLSKICRGKNCCN